MSLVLRAELLQQELLQEEATHPGMVDPADCLLLSLQLRFRPSSRWCRVVATICVLDKSREVFRFHILVLHGCYLRLGHVIVHERMEVR
jgi:hypothetical protein